MQRILTVPMGLCLLVQQLLLPNCLAEPLLRSNVLLSLKTKMGSITVNVATIWRTTLERLETAPIDAVCKAWLLSANLTNASYNGMDDFDVDTQANDESLYFTLHVPSTLARDVINTRWRRSIEDILADVTGQPVAIAVTNTLDDSGFSRRDMNNRFQAPRHHQTNDFAYYDFPTKSSLQHDVQDIQYGSVHSADNLTEVWDNEQHTNILLHNRLNPRYTFDTFIVGNSNRLAHAASLAVAEAPGESYNPLFLYGGVGLGKTHLLHAIGHQGVETGLAVLYVSSEQFTNEIINAIRYRTTEEFRAKYRSVDILLVDDIQFIAGKESTEEEFFHTFNSLYEMSKQIVICSDRPPKAIVSLEERLRSRFEWGLIADIQPPDLETRGAILRTKADTMGRKVPDDVVNYIASRVQSNIRELEGTFNRFFAFAQLQHLPLTIDTAKAALSNLAADGRQRRVTIAEILDAVAEFYRMPKEDLCGKQRDKHIVVPRQIAMFLMRQETEASLLEIGQSLGGRDHSTVLHGC